MAYDIHEILSRVSIVDYISKFVPLKKKGNNHWGICPFHNEKTPSFSVSEEKKLFKCFGCGIGGNVITFAKEYEKIEFPQALKLLADFAGIEEKAGSYEKKDPRKELKQDLYYLQNKVASVYQEALPRHPEAVEYLKSRRILPETASKLGIGYAPNVLRFLEGQLITSGITPESGRKIHSLLEESGLVYAKEGNTMNRFRGRIIFPIRDINGQTAAFGGRILGTDGNYAKYINSPENPVFEKKNILYHLYEAREEIRKEKNVYLVEGYFDVAGLVNQSVENVVAPMGTSFTDHQARLLKRYTEKVSIFFDNDPAGLEAAYKACVILRRNKIDINVIRIPDKYAGMDPYDISIISGKEELYSILDDPMSEIDFLLWYFFSKKYNTEKMEEKRKAIETFFEYLKDVDTQWEKEEFLRKASEKTSLSLDSIKNDFSTIEKNLPQVQEKTKRPPITNIFSGKYRHYEFELLGLFLRFPEFWEKESAVRSIIWNHEDLYLLYSFFRDRLKVGVYWPWEELWKASEEITSVELSSLLAEFIMGERIQFDKDNYREYLDSFQTILGRLRLGNMDDLYQEKKRLIRTHIIEQDDEVSIFLGNLVKEIKLLEKKMHLKSIPKE